MSHLKDASAGVRGMFDKIVRDYPEEHWPGGVQPLLKPYQRASSTWEIAGRGCRITVGSIYNHDFARGSDIAMAHLTEVAFWRDTACYSPDDLIRAVSGTVAMLPYTLVAIESTANGVGNYFHREWLRCKEGRGDKTAIFVPWYQSVQCRLEPPLPAEFAASLTAYERELWDERGLALDQIYWYRRKLAEYQTHRSMMAEYPTTDIEAFTATASNVFPTAWVERLRAGCREPGRGTICPDGRWEPDPAGDIDRWAAPETGADYIVAVDIADAPTRPTGRSRQSCAPTPPSPRSSPSGAATSTTTSWPTSPPASPPTTARRCSPSSQTPSRAAATATAPTSWSGSSPRLYMRGGGADGPLRPGFHTNRRTKEQVVSGLIRAVRLGEYIERDHRACDELLTYRTTPEGRYQAMAGCHDDILMTRAIALHLLPAAAPTAPLRPYLDSRRW